MKKINKKINIIINISLSLFLMLNILLFGALSLHNPAEKLNSNTLNKNCITGYKKDNEDSKNIWFGFGTVEINLAYKNDKYMFTVPIKYLKDMGGNPHFELTYKFGEPSNDTNSLENDDKDVFYDNAFHIICDKKIFYSDNNTYINNFYFYFDLHLKVFDRENNKWIIWYNYIYEFYLNYDLLLNLSSLDYSQDILTLNIPYEIDITDNYVAKYKCTLNTICKILSISNFLISDLISITKEPNYSFAYNSYVETPKDLVGEYISNNRLNCYNKNINSNKTDISIYDYTYYYPSKLQVTNSRDLKYSDNRQGLILNYYYDYSFLLKLNLSIKSFVNINLEVPFLVKSKCNITNTEFESNYKNFNFDKNINFNNKDITNNTKNGKWN